MKKLIESPFVQGNAILKKEQRQRAFRKEYFQVWEHFYECLKTQRQFTTDELDLLNVNQVYNQYRDKYHLLFPEQIKNTRERFGLNQLQMSKVLGLGVNMIRNYENGEMPSVSNATLLNVIRDPKVFHELFEQRIGLLEMSAARRKKIQQKLQQLIHKDSEPSRNCLPVVEVPDEFSGYALPNFEKLTFMVIYFLDKLDFLFKVKLNKLLFYSDFLHFQQSGKSISGIPYIAIKMGPVPEKYAHLYASMVDEEYLDVQELPSQEFDQTLERMIPIQKFQPALFTQAEIDTLEWVYQKLGFKSREQLVELSHEEKCWQELHPTKGKISYQKYAFEISDL